MTKDTLEAKGRESPEVASLQRMHPYPWQACNNHQRHHLTENKLFIYFDFYLLCVSVLINKILKTETETASASKYNLNVILIGQILILDVIKC